METLRLAQFSHDLKPRPRDFHKGDCGHVLVIGGDYGYSGSVLLAALSALRVGAGLVSVATRLKHARILNVVHPEIMCHAIDSAAELGELMKQASVIVLGPGLGRTSWGNALFEAALTSEKPLIVDADGLNLLAGHPGKKPNWILTPHPGEAARLLQTTVDVVQQDRPAAIQLLKEKFEGVIVLKGAGTLVLGDDGTVACCHAGNPGMATGGMGDVLSGVIGGLAAQGMSTIIAAQLGVLVHAMAGDLAAKEGERGMIATDLMPYLRQLVNVSSAPA